MTPQRTLSLWGHSDLPTPIDFPAQADRTAPY